MMKNPPYALILENVVAKAPAKPGLVGVSFQAPCASFADTSCENTKIDVNVVGGIQATPKLAVERVLGEFRLQDGKGTIMPVLTITGSGGKPRSVKVESIVPLPKVQK